ncbi:hypothetical protein [uncultured Chitinophaga sp.]|mgnify:CR=1 FL=1|jgi:hypothetical protein|uniref:hypothetical protein n=1 Tax=uncultured Chitinophaga sp. TaxID=339340 RepID=UPI002635426B|nr:hypothetical protein [uncultured Chitinophaga sp.]
MTNDILLFTRKIAAAADEIKLLGGRITQQFTNYIFVAILPDISDVGKLRYSREQQYGPLDDKSKLAFDAWHLSQVNLSAKTAAGPPEDLSWDAFGFEPPLTLQARSEAGTEILGSTGTSTSLYLIGSVAMGLVLVAGTTPGLGFTYDEMVKIVAEVMKGLQFLVHAEPRANISFVYNIHIKTVDVIPLPPGSCGRKEDPCEALWRNPVLQQLGFPPQKESLELFANQLQRINETDWSFVAFITKYPLYHVAYAGGVRTCIQYPVGDWGPDGLHQVFAHEVAHIFGAADEYEHSGCGCGPSGYLQIPNMNCINCAGNRQVGCLMNKTTLNLCRYSAKQLGWSSKFFDPLLLKQISPVCDSNNDLYVFAVDVHNTLYLNIRFRGIWLEWSKNWNKAPAMQFVTTLWDASGNLHVFGIGTDNTLYVNKRTNFRWSGWQANWHQAPKLSGITAFADTKNTVYVFGIAPDNTVYLNRHVGNSWSGWMSGWYNAPRLKSITAATDSKNNLFIVGMAPDNTLYLISHKGDSWSGWQYNWDEPPPLKSVLAVPDIDKTVYVLGLGTDNILYCNTHDDGKWSGWYAFPDTPRMQSFNAVTDGRDGLYLWGIDMDGALWLNVSEVERQWTGWQSTWNKDGDFYKPVLHNITGVMDRHKTQHIWGTGVNKHPMGNNYITWCNWHDGNGWKGWEYQWYM